MQQRHRNQHIFQVEAPHKKQIERIALTSGGNNSPAAPCVRRAFLQPQVGEGLAVFEGFAQEEISLSFSDGQKASVSTWVDGNLDAVVETYKHLHANPELSFQEFKTSALVAKSLEKTGFDVTSGIGRTGVVAVLKNGEWLAPSTDRGRSWRWVAL